MQIYDTQPLATRRVFEAVRSAREHVAILAGAFIGWLVGRLNARNLAAESLLNTSVFP